MGLISVLGLEVGDAGGEGKEGRLVKYPENFDCQI